VLEGGGGGGGRIPNQRPRSRFPDPLGLRATGEPVNGDPHNLGGWLDTARLGAFRCAVGSWTSRERGPRFGSPRVFTAGNPNAGTRPLRGSAPRAPRGSR